MQLGLREIAATRYLRCGFGVLSMALGGWLAILSIPQDFGAQGALAPTAFIVLASLLLPTLLSWRGDARSLLCGENVLILATVYWVLLDVLQGAYALSVPRDAVERELILLAVVSIGFWVGATLFPPLAPRFMMAAASQPWSPVTLFRALLIAFALGFWDFVYRADFDLGTVLQSLQASRFDSAWQREALGDWSAFSYHLQYFGYMVPALAILLALKLGWRSPRVWLALLMSVALLAFHAQGGARRIIGAMVLAGLFCWLIYAQRLTLRRFALAGLAVAMLAALMQLMLVLRDVGLGDDRSPFATWDYLHVDDNFLRIAQMLEFVPESHPFVGFQYLLYALVRPIPRVLWPEKPVDGGFDLAEVLGIPFASFALTAGGEFYVSFGYWGVLLGGIAYGRLASMANAMLTIDPAKLNPLFPSLVLVWVFVGTRSMIEIMLMGYVLAAAIVLSKVMSFLESPRGSAAAAPSSRRT